jgi:CheY-like chemotaxis protein
MKAPVPTMLQVEDDENDRLLLKIAQETAKLLMNLITVEDGEQAIAYLKGEGAYSNRTRSPLPSLVLLDLKLPRKGGFEVLEWIRGQQSLKDLPVIVMSSSAQECDRLRALRSGANAYLVKPILLASLVEMIERIYFQWLAGFNAAAPSSATLETSGQRLLTAAC